MEVVQESEEQKSSLVLLMGCKSISQMHTNVPISKQRPFLKDSNYETCWSPHNPEKDGQGLQIIIWLMCKRPGQTGSCETWPPHVPPTWAFALQPWGHTLPRASPPGNPPSPFKQPKPSQHGMNARRCSTYHFTQHKLLINCRAFQRHRGIILQDELSAIRNQEKD